MKVNREEWLEWIGHPVTQLYRDHIKELMEAIKDDWGNGV